MKLKKLLVEAGSGIANTQCPVGQVFTPDDKYLFVAYPKYGNNALYVTLKRDEYSFVRTDELIEELPTTVANSCAVSPDGKFLAITHATAPYLSLYVWNGEMYTPRAIPASAAHSYNYNLACCFSNDGNWFVLVQNDGSHGQYIIRSYYVSASGGFSQRYVSGWEEFSGQYPTFCTYSPDDNYLSVMCRGGAALQVFRVTASIFNNGEHITYEQCELPNGNVERSYHSSFGPSGNIIAFTYSAYDYRNIIAYRKKDDLTFWQLRGSTFTEYYRSTNDAHFHPKKNYLVGVRESDPRICVYSLTEPTTPAESYVFTLVPNAVDEMPVGYGLRCMFSNTGNFLATFHTSTGISIYAVDKYSLTINTVPSNAVAKVNVGQDSFDRLLNPPTPPANTGRGCAFSTDDKYLAVAHATSPYISIYKRNDDVFTKLANPTGGLPTGDGWDCAFSSNGDYLAVVHEYARYLTIYKRNGDNFTKLPNPDDLPIGFGYGCTFSSDDTYLVVAHNNDPYVTIYKRNGDIFTKLPGLTGGLPAGISRGCAFSPDDAYLAIAHHGNPRITIYKRNGDSFNKLPTPTGGTPIGTNTTEYCDCAFSPDGKYLAVSYNGMYKSAFVYERNDDAFTKVAEIGEIYTGSYGRGCTFSLDNKYLAVAHSPSPYISVYKIDGGEFNKIDNPVGLPTGTGWGCAFSSDTTYLAVAHSNSPYVTIYKNNSYWSDGKYHLLEPGNYNYNVHKDQYHPKDDYVDIIDQDKVINVTLDLITYSLTINTTPANAIAEVKINGSWINGKIHDLQPGSYSYRVSMNGYTTKTGSISIVDKNETLNVILDKSTYKLTITTVPANASAEVKIDNEWIAGKIHNLESRLYEYRVFATGYDTKTDYVAIMDNDKDITVTLDKTKYKLTINTTPSDATAEVKINNSWVAGKIHDLEPGTYDYKVSRDGYYDKTGSITITNTNETVEVSLDIIKYALTINTTPSAAIAKVKINNKWVTGKTHDLAPGNYEYEVSMDGYVTETDTVTITDDDKVLNITLNKITYTLTINTTPSDATAEVKINDEWVEGKVHSLEPGTYEYKVSKVGYTDKTGSVIIVNKNETINISLEVGTFKLTINTTPSDAIAEVKVNNNWVTGKIYNLEAGEYEYKVHKEGYDTETDTVTIVNEDKTLNVTLDRGIYSLTINTTPSNALAEVKINDTWVSGKSHNLESGTYEYRVSLSGYITETESFTILNNKVINVTLELIKYQLTINTIPSDATAEVYINNTWVSGKIHTLEPNTYEYRVSRVGYVTKTGSVDIVSSDKIVNVTLEGIKYKLTINTIPLDATAEINIDGGWISGKVHNLVPGVYEYRVSRDGYSTKTGSTVIDNKDENITVNLNLITYSLTINTIPSNAVAEIRVDDNWIVGKLFDLAPGVYEYRVSLSGYKTEVGTVTIIDINKTLNIDLSLITFTLDINTTPESAIAELKIDGIWVTGKTHNVSPGVYDYRVSMVGYSTKTGSVVVDGDKTLSVILEMVKYNLTINTVPANAIAEIQIGEYWVSGKQHSLVAGEYNYKVSAVGYDDSTGVATIVNKDEEVNVVLDRTRYKLTISTVPYDAIAEVEIDGVWTAGKVHELLPGIYNYRVSKEDYPSKTGSTIIIDKDETIHVNLGVTTHKLTINTIPFNANAKVKINEEWITGKQFNLESGTYDYEVSMFGYSTETGSVTITNEDRVLTITLYASDYQLIINTIPYDAVAKVKINENWIEGKEHNLESGTYEYKVSAEGCETETGSVTIENEDMFIYIILYKYTYNLTINTIPDDAIAEVNIGGSWIAGKSHVLEPGTYAYRASRDGYATKSGSTTIINEDKTIYIDLTTSTYVLTINPTPSDALVEVKIDNIWMAGKEHNLPSGTYEYRVSKSAYITIEDMVEIVSSNVDLDVELVSRQKSGIAMIRSAPLTLTVDLTED